MKKILLSFLMLFSVATIFTSCSEQEENVIAPEKEGRVITVRPVIEEQITPMRNAEEGLEYNGYTLKVTDEVTEIVKENVSLNDDINVHNVTGDFTLELYHQNKDVLVSEVYYLNGKAEGANVDEVVTVRMKNTQFSYILVDGAEDEVKGASIDGFEFLPESDEMYPNFYAYIQGGTSHKVLINTVRGYAGITVDAVADIQYTYSVNFSTDGNIIIDPGFNGDPIEFDPITNPMKPIVAFEDILGAEDLSFDYFTGVVTGISSERRDGTHQVHFFGATGMDRKEVIHLSDVNPSFDVETNSKELHMSIYVNDYSSKSVSLFADGTVRDTVGDKLYNSWSEFANANPDVTITTTWIEGVKVNCNFIVRIGWSSNKEKVNFTLNGLSY
ncbi:hypothetical protein KMW28_01410 [Flammeovirga yaeyamensis]|uniref:Lipoprotein n=1 Tax=Flammeovirga yaeyamensis TaxID=367791 RepID=A0AAX1N8M0_9BACT|nr:hypothetical protein [Flammeovirga yaeyamensis]MBB3699742.1 hypothetical protein [Flammeovirga yaeyamensis]NMF36688.1 hypothetical protein [Flammeovirga yaeyamensis]QWG02268.1 hypothetical protein KMW28_01410 [Flammeovirga yaeyamensis]